MATHRLWISRWRPAKKNDLKSGRHWGVSHRRKQYDADVVKSEAFMQDVPTATGKRRVSITVLYAKNMRTCDGDAFWLSLLDALKRCRLLVDDSPKWCETTPVGQRRVEDGEEWGSMIELTDLD